MQVTRVSAGPSACSHDLAVRIDRGWSLGVLLTRQKAHVEAKALERAEQAVGVVFGGGIGLNHGCQLTGETHLPSHRFQLPGVPFILGKGKEERES